jgi:hypothetical protein
VVVTAKFSLMKVTPTTAVVLCTALSIEPAPSVVIAATSCKRAQGVIFDGSRGETTGSAGRARVGEERREEGREAKRWRSGFFLHVQHSCDTTTIIVIAKPSATLSSDVVWRTSQRSVRCYGDENR